MKSLYPFVLALVILNLFSCEDAAMDKELKPSLMLWYDTPAANWTEALPIGNGRLGAMVYGGTSKEIIQFNEETLWTGQPNDYAHPGAHQVLSELRQLLWNGKQDEAHILANERFMSKPHRQLSYQPFGNILLSFPNHSQVENYKRQLDLENAVSSISYEVDGVKYQREVIASNPDQVIAVHVQASENGKLNFDIGLDSPHSRYEVTVEGDELVLKGRANNYPKKLDPQKQPYPESKMTFEARLKVANDGGELLKEGNTIKVKNANSATLYLVAATNFVNYSDISENPGVRCGEYMTKLEDIPYGEVKSNHIKDHQELFSRVEIDLGESEISDRPTNERLMSFQEDLDPNLVSLVYQYGRYLLIASSRKGTQPANLQGIWNDKLEPSWDSKYTININTEMNYWLAEMTNLSELTEPLTRMIEDLTVSGRTVAKEHYDLEGWVVHHNTDLWRGAAPINNSNHGIWPTGGAWLSQHLWWHYQYTDDLDFLKNTAYPILKDASIFFAQYLVPDPDHPEWLVSGPSNSPENGGLVMAPTMDHQIIRNLFANTMEAAEILNVDADFIEVLRNKRSKIAPNLIGQYGQLQEWLKDQDDPENKHRHVSHLWGLHPGNEIHPYTTPDLAEAARTTLTHRGDGGTGWSRAWKINFWARLLDGDHAFLLLKNLMVPSRSQGVEMNDKGGLYLNLFDAHPPFQIDGNFGATSGITEMLLQSHLRDEEGDYFQDILPALPSRFPEGKISGIKGRGAFEISIEWKNGALVGIDVTSLEGNKLNLRYGGKSISKQTKKGESMSYGTADFQ
jgi:alpha-L-fucosidase 2